MRDVLYQYRFLPNLRNSPYPLLRGDDNHRPVPSRYFSGSYLFISFFIINRPGHTKHDSIGTGRWCNLYATYMRKGQTRIRIKFAIERGRDVVSSYATWYDRNEQKFSAVIKAAIHHTHTHTNIYIYIPKYRGYPLYIEILKGERGKRNKRRKEISICIDNTGRSSSLTVEIFLLFVFFFFFFSYIYIITASANRSQTASGIMHSFKSTYRLWLCPNIYIYIYIYTHTHRCKSISKEWWKGKRKKEKKRKEKRRETRIFFTFRSPVVNCKFCLLYSVSLLPVQRYHWCLLWSVYKTTYKIIDQSITRDSLMKLAS